MKTHSHPALTLRNAISEVYIAGCRRRLTLVDCLTTDEMLFIAPTYVPLEFFSSLWQPTVISYAVDSSVLIGHVLVASMPIDVSQYSLCYGLDSARLFIILISPFHATHTILFNRSICTMQVHFICVITVRPPACELRTSALQPTQPPVAFPVLLTALTLATWSYCRSEQHINACYWTVSRGWCVSPETNTSD